MELAIGLGDNQVIDAGMSRSHQTLFVELPILISVGAEPVPESSWYSYAKRTAMRFS
jgi:hypothetical protein